MNNASILIMSDERETAEVWAHGLRRRGATVVTATLNDPPESVHGYNLVVVNVDDVGVEALQPCRRMRAKFVGPILVFTYEQNEPFHLQLYHEGIDESIPKPIGIPLFLAKVTAWLQRAATPLKPITEPSAKGFDMDSFQRILTAPDGVKKKMSHLEYRLMSVLLNNRGQVLETEVLIDRVWTDGDGDSHMLKNLIYRLRRKIEPNPQDPQYIETIAGHGYRFRSKNPTGS